AGRIAAWFQDPARNRPGYPDIVAITDETGRVIARDKDINRMYDQSLLPHLPALRQVFLDGTARHDVWFQKDEKKLLQTSIAPVRGGNGAIVGALIVGYDLSNGLASSEAHVLGRDVAFLVNDEGGKIYSSSLSTQEVGPLRDFLFGTMKSSTE